VATTIGALVLRCSSAGELLVAALIPKKGAKTFPLRASWSTLIPTASPRSRAFFMAHMEPLTSRIFWPLSLATLSSLQPARPATWPASSQWPAWPATKIVPVPSSA
jgi:hypothetical protein